jgi:hypothetical protein
MLDLMTSLATPAPRTCCPLCGEANGCAPAASGTFATPCWCAAARFPPALLAALPPGEAPACVCAACIRRAHASVEATDAAT